MATLTDSQHFVNTLDIPVVDEHTPMYETYQALSAAPDANGGFIVGRSGSELAYIKAYELAQTLIAEGGEENKLTAVSDRPIKELIDTVKDSSSILRIPQQNVEVSDDSQPLQEQADTVFRVTRNGVSVGWFLNHEEVLATLTRKTKFICSDGHENNDPDHGTCYECPNPIVRVES